MPWETKFNIDNAIDQAINVFWAKGYKSTSLNDLLDAMEINKGSFYNTFGSKKKNYLPPRLIDMNKGSELTC